MFYVYLLQSQVDETYYIGHTQDLGQRIKRHNSGEVNATRKKYPGV
ncbi:MAG: hypothetical protein COT26_02760 [Candidatus Kerfeldbacteria bacterium CG08_land_8_20_14_0_20_43_14]|uniref:GIY-YIG domain-containing protein n=1 Tax=Candidatus Kerfeldbacteria bacterium CG08_land_8_20_14_0_20_43_14 TaxID=2014246 RepID=A0A2H0YQ51_9BACT|nr:MAG: hypothetical protein COT26_02760 [Candidatus Kerfeldbacteria bacterium CG08_land_8_20_14_0_20_43_14]